MSVAETNIAEVNAVFDRVLAYALGQSSESDRHIVEEKLQAGDPSYVMSHARVVELLGELPSVLVPVAPPSFIKERVMAEIAQPVPHAETGAQAPSHYAAPQASRFVQAFTAVKRSSIFAGMLLGGILVSGYAVEQLIGNMQLTDESSQSYTALQPKSPFTARTLPQSPDVQTANPVEAPPAVLARETDQSASKSGNYSNSDATHEGDAYPGHMQTNFGTAQAQLFLKSDPLAMQYALGATASGAAGEARLLWDEAHSDALLSVSGLEPTTESSHYVLWYLRDGTQPVRMLNFSRESNTPMSFFVNRAPSEHVTGVMITMEHSTAQGRVESEEVLRATDKQHLNTK